MQKFEGARLCYAVFALALLAQQIQAASDASTIELHAGGLIEGDILRERADSIVVDLGFEVLTVPRDAIAAIRANDPEVQARENRTRENRLYRTSDKDEEMPVKELAERNGEAVVLVKTPVGLGSGFIVHPNGYVVTNDHVIAGEHRVSITVFEDGELDLVRQQYENVRIVASNPQMDLALLKIEGASREFPTVAIGDSDMLRPGQPLFAIGSPLGLDRTVSQGIVSLRNRLIGGRIYIQTTTQISPGNSGGPLFNLKGEVIGVNNMKVVGMGAEGLSFSIPSEVLKMFLENRDAFAFDPRNPNAGFRYNEPPRPVAPAGKSAGR
jgi:serine protease Do